MDLKVGMMWFDDTRGRPLADKIARAADHYRAKYGRSSDICYISADRLAQGQPPPQGMRLKGAPDILPDHFWLGSC